MTTTHTTDTTEPAEPAEPAAGWFTPGTGPLPAVRPTPDTARVATTPPDGVPAAWPLSGAWDSTDEQLRVLRLALARSEHSLDLLRVDLARQQQETTTLQQENASLRDQLRAAATAGQLPAGTIDVVDDTGSVLYRATCDQLLTDPLAATA